MLVHRTLGRDVKRYSSSVTKYTIFSIFLFAFKAGEFRSKLVSGLFS